MPDNKIRRNATIEGHNSKKELPLRRQLVALLAKVAK
jgi:hypothetical protein